MPVSKRFPERDGEVEDGAKAFLVTKPLSLHQLTAEYAGAGFVAEGDLAGACEETPVVVWALGSDDDTNMIKRLITDHMPQDENEGFYGLLAKARQNHDLSNDEIQQAIRLLLERAGRGA